jgi:hypothetical protein
VRFWINRAPKIYKSQPYAHNCIGFGSDAPTKNAAGNPTAFLVHKGKKETQRLSGRLPRSWLFPRAALIDHPEVN